VIEVPLERLRGEPGEELGEAAAESSPREIAAATAAGVGAGNVAEEDILSVAKKKKTKHRRWWAGGVYFIYCCQGASYLSLSLKWWVGVEIGHLRFINLSLNCK
jgi:hypothetical protein